MTGAAMRDIGDAIERPPTVLAYLTGTSERVHRATALVVLRMAQLHSQRAGAHEALVEAEADLARALGFAPPVPPVQAPAPEPSPAPAMPPKVEALLAPASRSILDVAAHFNMPSRGAAVALLEPLLESGEIVLDGGGYTLPARRQERAA